MSLKTFLSGHAATACASGSASGFAELGRGWSVWAWPLPLPSRFLPLRPREPATPTAPRTGSNAARDSPRRDTVGPSPRRATSRSPGCRSRDRDTASRFAPAPAMPSMPQQHTSRLQTQRTTKAVVAWHGSCRKGCDGCQKRRVTNSRSSARSPGRSRRRVRRGRSASGGRTGAGRRRSFCRGPSWRATRRL